VNLKWGDEMKELNKADVKEVRVDGVIINFIGHDDQILESVDCGIEACVDITLWDIEEKMADEKTTVKYHQSVYNSDGKCTELTPEQQKEFEEACREIGA
jgi:hypothetical protein